MTEPEELDPEIERILALPEDEAWREYSAQCRSDGLNPYVEIDRLRQRTLKLVRDVVDGTEAARREMR